MPDVLSAGFWGLVSGGALEDGKGSVTAHRGPITVGRREEIEDLGDVDDAREHGNGPAGQPIGISVSVPPFVVVADGISDLPKTFDPNDALSHLDVQSVGAAILGTGSRMHVEPIVIEFPHPDIVQ